MRRAQIPGENHLLPFGFHLHIGRTQDVASALEFDLGVPFHRLPDTAVQRTYMPLYLLQKGADQVMVAGKADLEGVFYDQWQESGRGPAAIMAPWNPAAIR